MLERYNRMLLVLDLAISVVRDRGCSTGDVKHQIEIELRRAHANSVRVRSFGDAWVMHELMRMLDDSPTVNDIRRELRARTSTTPHSNRGVTQGFQPGDVFVEGNER